MLLQIPEQVLRVMKLVKGYLVGGSVRDLLMGREPADFDIATPYTPDEVERILMHHGIKVYEVGKRFGTVGAVVKPYKIEITTFRREMYDFKSRKPAVKFTKDIIQDLSRRDFTINAMALSYTGELIDPFGGMQDIKRKIIRFVGNAEHRILEDPLRILRAFRFAARFGFKIDNNSLKAIEKLMPELRRISKERIKDELMKAANTRAFHLYCELNYKYGAFHYYGPTWGKVIDAMAQTYHSVGYGHYGESAWQHTIDVLKRMDMWGYAARLKLAGLLHDVGKPATKIEKHGVVHFYVHENIGAEIAKKMLIELRFSNKMIKYVVFLVKYHMRIGIAIQQYRNGKLRALARLFAKAIMEGHKHDIIDLLYLYQADSGDILQKGWFELAKWIEIYVGVPKFRKELVQRIPPMKRKEHIYGILVEHIMRLLHETKIKK